MGTLASLALRGVRASSTLDIIYLIKLIIKFIKFIKLIIKFIKLIIKFNKLIMKFIKLFIKFIKFTIKFIKLNIKSNKLSVFKGTGVGISSDLSLLDNMFNSENCIDCFCNNRNSQVNYSEKPQFKIIDLQRKDFSSFLNQTSNSRNRCESDLSLFYKWSTFTTLILRL